VHHDCTSNDTDAQSPASNITNQETVDLSTIDDLDATKDPNETLEIAAPADESFDPYATEITPSPVLPKVSTGQTTIIPTPNTTSDYYSRHAAFVWRLDSFAIGCADDRSNGCVCRYREDGRVCHHQIRSKTKNGKTVP
jgi:hypothetical protein